MYAKNIPNVRVDWILQRNNSVLFWNIRDCNSFCHLRSYQSKNCKSLIGIESSCLIYRNTFILYLNFFSRMICDKLIPLMERPQEILQSLWERALYQKRLLPVLPIRMKQHEHVYAKKATNIDRFGKHYFQCGVKKAKLDCIGAQLGISIA